jgi:uncharacterized protein YceK
LDDLEEASWTTQEMQISTWNEGWGILSLQIVKAPFSFLLQITHQSLPAIASVYQLDQCWAWLSAHVVLMIAINTIIASSSGCALVLSSAAHCLLLRVAT